MTNINEEVRGKPCDQLGLIFHNSPIPCFACTQSRFGLFSFRFLLDDHQQLAKGSRTPTAPKNQQRDHGQKPAVAEPLDTGQHFPFRCGHDDRPEGIGEGNGHVERMSWFPLHHLRREFGRTGRLRARPAFESSRRPWQESRENPDSSRTRKCRHVPAPGNRARCLSD